MAENFDKWRANIEEREYEFEYKGEKVKIKYKPLTWSKKNQILSQCASANGETLTFNTDLYLKECLSNMIIEAPWGKTDRIFLTQIDSELGDLLQGIVPVPTGENKKENFSVSKSEEL